MNNVDDHLASTHETTPLQGTFVASLKEKIRSSIGMDSREQDNNDVNKSNNKNRLNNNSVVIDALESLLHEKISESQLQSNDHSGITTMYHCKQLESWDCGIACLLMVNRWLSTQNKEYSSKMVPEDEKLRETLIGNIGAKSIWTADLVLELHKLLGQGSSADYIFCSKNMGVDESYKDFGYYRDNFARDQERVNDAFVELQTCSTSCFSTSHLPLPLVMNAVSHPNCIAIALVDNTKLHGFDWSEYLGHYVIICGCSSDPSHLDLTTNVQNEDRCLVLKNTGRDDDPTMYVLPSRFERSWRASGTDDDIVFVIRQ
ncbi:unnamed protein product [Cylindrotheca closterium]|uniref:Uncharacterized protein n=1 Tax=Cylindrotheca closterium TaxID=2856 RepID=A0AAD2FBS1_9STRA|nr:unnamed protein product [Cylindrotheca closterium]